MTFRNKSGKQSARHIGLHFCLLAALAASSACSSSTDNDAAAVASAGAPPQAGSASASGSTGLGGAQSNAFGGATSAGAGSEATAAGGASAETQPNLGAISGGTAPSLDAQAGAGASASGGNPALTAGSPATPQAGAGPQTPAAGSSSQPLEGPATGCSFELTTTMSEVIPTVGIVEWSSSLEGPTVAQIDFGLDSSYGMSAPVDLTELDNRTLLLGMKPGKEYHFRVNVSNGTETCQSEDQTLTTGPAPNALPYPEITTNLPAQLADGYIITTRWGDSGGPAFIMDKDRDIVWWYRADDDDIMRVRMSYDGKRMWLRNTGQNNGTGWVRRITLDGLTEEFWDLGATTHDLAVIPNGNIGLVAHATENTCDEIIEFNPETEEIKHLFNLSEAHGALDCHVNAITYVAEDDTFVMSDWAESVYVKITRDGELVWVLNGPSSDFAGTNWEKQHSLHMLTADHILLFNNADGSPSSKILQYQLDVNSGTATETWSYDAGISTGFGGDVQRLGNGNTLISYSVSGVMQEVTNAGEVVQELEWESGNTIAYHSHRKTLYGPPPRIHPYQPD